MVAESAVLGNSSLAPGTSNAAPISGLPSSLNMQVPSDETSGEGCELEHLGTGHFGPFESRHPVELECKIRSLTDLQPISLGDGSLFHRGCLIDLSRFSTQSTFNTSARLRVSETSLSRVSLQLSPLPLVSRIV